jgi:hypothetical protein
MADKVTLLARMGEKRDFTSEKSGWDENGNQ